MPVRSERPADAGGLLRRGANDVIRAVLDELRRIVRMRDVVEDREPEKQTRRTAEDIVDLERVDLVLGDRARDDPSIRDERRIIEEHAETRERIEHAAKAIEAAATEHRKEAARFAAQIGARRRERCDRGLPQIVIAEDARRGGEEERNAGIARVQRWTEHRDLMRPARFVDLKTDAMVVAAIDDPSGRDLARDRQHLLERTLLVERRKLLFGVDSVAAVETSFFAARAIRLGRSARDAGRLAGEGRADEPRLDGGVLLRKRREHPLREIEARLGEDILAETLDGAR